MEIVYCCQQYKLT